MAQCGEPQCWRSWGMPKRLHIYSLDIAMYPLVWRMGFWNLPASGKRDFTRLPLHQYTIALEAVASGRPRQGGVDRGLLDRRIAICKSILHTDPFHSRSRPHHHSPSRLVRGSYIVAVDISYWTLSPTTLFVPGNHIEPATSPVDYGTCSHLAYDPQRYQHIPHRLATCALRKGQ